MIQEFVRFATFFCQVSIEEELLLNIMDAADELINDKKYSEAINMLNQAFSFELWRKMYASQILLNLGKW